jgi:hypothetical protein
MIDALCIFTIAALIVGAIISHGEERYTFSGTALLVSLIYTFVCFA